MANRKAIVAGIMLSGALVLHAPVGGAVNAAAQQESVAHLWVDRNGGTCTRSATPLAYDDAAACGSFDAAYDAANAHVGESLVYVKAGTYGDQQITGNRTSPSRIVIEPAPGEVVVIGALRIGSHNKAEGPDYLTIRGFQTSEYGGSANHAPTNRRSVWLSFGTTFIIVENMHAGSLQTAGTKDAIVRNNEFGPCKAAWDIPGDPATSRCTAIQIDGGWEGSKPERMVERFLFEGNFVRDFQFASSCFTIANGGTNTGSPDCHHECMFLNGGSDITVRGNTFRDCAIFDVFTEDTQAYGYTNLTIENNFFGTPISYGSPGNYTTPSYTRRDALTLECKANRPGFNGLTVRNNSFARNTGVSMSLASSCASTRGIVFTGNIMVKPACSAQATYAYNVYNSLASGTCGATDVNIGGTTWPFYAENTLVPGPTSYMLAGPRAVPDQFVQAAVGCPQTDKFGTPRPLASGFCSAGAHERLFQTAPQPPTNVRIIR